MSVSTTAAIRVRRTIRSSPVVRACVGTPGSRRTIGALRAARVLRPTGRFLAGEAKARGVGRFAIRGTELVVHLRHGSRDVEILNEIFRPGRASYEPPAEVAAALNALGPLRVGDLGGNIGLFGLYALGRWRVQRLHSYEPDPANAALLDATITANAAGERWESSRVAVSNEDTIAAFEVGLLSESRIAAGSRIADGDCVATATIEVPVVDLFSQPPCDLLKIDIEGAEWPILADPRLASYPARAIVLEWHRRMCPAPDPRTATRKLLQAAGYESVFEDAEQTPTNGVIWGLRR